jgi:uncharacterized protein Yka (UPF0111/DUF47 family)
VKELRDLNEPQLADLMRSMAKAIEKVSADADLEKPMFVILLFNEPARGQYISNCKRSQTIEALRETADRLELRQTVERDPFPDVDRN